MGVETRAGSISNSQQASARLNTNNINMLNSNLNSSQSSGSDSTVSNTNTDSDKCGTCKVVVDEDGRGMACNICKQWFHITCVGISDTLYDVLNDNNIGAIHWYCSACNKVADGIMSNISKVLKNQDEIANDLVSIKSSVGDNSEQISVLKSSVSTCETSVTVNTDNIATLIIRYYIFINYYHRLQAYR